MRKLAVISIAIITLIVLATRSGAYAQAVSITSPQTGALFQQTGGTSEITVSADATGIPVGGGVEFVLDAGAYNWRTQTDPTPPYSTTFTGVPTGEHTLDVFAVAANGVRLGATDHKYKIGVGDIIVAMGDSITAGEVDDILSDNWSTDGRTGPHVDEATGIEYGGFEPILADMLTAVRGHPVMLINRGVPGDTSYAAAANAYAIAHEYPTAHTWILAYGSNDAGSRVSPYTLRSNLQTAIQHIREINPNAEFYIPKVFYNQKYESTVTEYHNVIGDITRNVDGVRWGADLDSLFRSNHMLYDHLAGQTGTWFGPIASHHPNGVGVQKMALLWKMAMVDNAFLVTDGVPGTVGNTWADQLRLDGTNAVGLNAANLLQVRPQVPAGSPPAGTAFLCPWAHSLYLTGGSTLAGALTVTVRVEEDNLPLGGASSWSQVWLASGPILLPTTRAVNPRNVRNHDFSALVTQPGQLACVVDVTPPVSTHSLDPPDPGLGKVWYTTPPLITLMATDSTGLPVSSIIYRWDSSSEQVYAEPLIALKGAHTLHYHAVDQSGNVEQDRSVDILVVSAASTPIVSDNARYVQNTETVNVSWYVDDPGGGVAQYQYAVGTYAGASDLQGWTSVGTSTGIAWSPRYVPLGTTIFFSVKAFSSDWQSSPIGCSDGVAVPVPVGAIANARVKLDGTPVAITRLISTALLGDALFVESADRSAGLAVYGTEFVPAARLMTVMGRMATVDGQRALVESEVRNSTPATIPRPISLNIANLRLDNDPKGPSTYGLLVRIYGKVASTGSDWFRMNDGSLLANRTLYVDASRLSTLPASGSIVNVTGVCTSVLESGVWRPAVTPRDDRDFQRIR